MRLCASYPSLAALAADVQEQLGRGGLLVRGEVPGGLQMYADVELEVACDEAGAVVVAAQVIQMFPGLGVAVSLDANARAQIEALAAGTHDALPPDEEPAQHGLAQGSQQTGRQARPSASPVALIQQALHGDRDQRMAVLRAPSRTVHVHVLRNPALTLEEVVQIAKMTTVSVELLKGIAERREWSHRPEVAVALLRNPTVPPQAVIPLLDYVSDEALRQLAKDSRTRDAIQRAARKKLLT